MIARGEGVGDRQETCDERADRLWGELLHEVRVAFTGVQLLFAFLLAAAFTPLFARLGQTDRLLYVGCVVLGAAAIGTLTAPVCLHRLVTGLGVKPEAVVWAARLTSAGLVLFFGTIALALLVVLRMVVSGPVALVIDAVLLLWFAACWLLPALLLRRAVSDRAPARETRETGEATARARDRARDRAEERGRPDGVRRIHAASWPGTGNS
ncbi:DUF6328 family protein [Streptomyces sp. NPDC015232]|uniref:DUF6328 family protein n=1 Tax=unclassified Streptomyces TaxID=2593676 RepID=UPI0036F591E8